MIHSYEKNEQNIYERGQESARKCIKSGAQHSPMPGFLHVLMQMNCPLNTGTVIEC